MNSITASSRNPSNCGIRRSSTRSKNRPPIASTASRSSRRAPPISKWPRLRWRVSSSPRGTRLGTATNYRRELDISTGVHRTTFIQNGVTYTREALASRPDQVLVFHYTAEREGRQAPALSGRIRLQPGQPNVQVVAEADALSWDAVMPNQLKHACRLQVLHQGGSVQTEGDALAFADCESLTLLLAARTDYAPHYETNWRGEPPAPAIARDIAAANSKSCRSAAASTSGGPHVTARPGAGRLGPLGRRHARSVHRSAAGRLCPGSQRSRLGADDVPIREIPAGQLLAAW